jgi:hypothetical protein
MRASAHWGPAARAGVVDVGADEGVAGERVVVDYEVNDDGDGSGVDANASADDDIEVALLSPGIGLSAQRRRPLHGGGGGDGGGSAAAAVVPADLVAAREALRLQLAGGVAGDESSGGTPRAPHPPTPVSVMRNAFSPRPRSARFVRERYGRLFTNEGARTLRPSRSAGALAGAGPSAPAGPVLYVMGSVASITLGSHRPVPPAPPASPAHRATRAPSRQ